MKGVMSYLLHEDLRSTHKLNEQLDIYIMYGLIEDRSHW